MASDAQHLGSLFDGQSKRIDDLGLDEFPRMGRIFESNGGIIHPIRISAMKRVCKRRVTLDIILFYSPYLPYTPSRFAKDAFGETDQSGSCGTRVLGVMLVRLRVAISV